VRTQYELAADRAEAEVRSFVEQVTESRDRARAQRLALEQAERGYSIARAQYREGIGSQLEITDAEVALRQSEFNYAEAVYDHLVARARLDQSMGVVPEVEARSRVAMATETRDP
jgi:outer membrane protein TolC